MEKTKVKKRSVAADYALMTVASVIMVAGIYFFKFPNDFCFGGVSGIAVILGAILPYTPGWVNLVLNIILLLLGFIFLGKSFGIRTTYVSILVSIGPAILEKVCPMSGPMTSQPVLELLFAIVMPSVASAIFFNIGASSGGTDIMAMILKKYTKLNIGSALFAVDTLIVVAACFVFDIQTGLFSLTGLLAKSLVVDGVIENINLAKYFTIICDDPQPICDFIINHLKKSATVYEAQGAYEHKPKTVVLTILKRGQAVELKNYIRQNYPTAFIAITNSSEIIGKGFRGLN